MRTTRATVLLAGLALAASGCGSSTDDVKSAVNGYLKAFVNGDGQRACSLMTSTTRQQFVARVSSIVHTSDCAKAISALRQRAGSQVAAALREAKVTKVKVAGDTAVATLTTKTSIGTSTSTTLLQKEGGSWKITSAPGTQ